MKSSLCLALSLSTFFSTSLSLPSHSHIRKGHASAMKEARAIKDNLMSPLVERSEVEDLTSLNKRSVRRFGTLDFGNTLQSRSNEDGEDDEEDEDEDDEEDNEEDDEDCDDESDSDSSSESDPNTSTTSPTSSNTAQNTSAQTYTVSSPKKVPSWKKNTTSTYTAPKKTEPTTSSNTAQNTSAPTYTVSSPKKVPSWKKETTSTYTATKKTKPTVDVSAGVSVSTGSGSSSSSSSTGISVGVTTYSGKATFFSQGGVAGACGTVHQDSDYVVAIDASMYEGGKFCGKTIAVTRVSTGKTIHCTGADECPECPSVQSLDLSIAAFNALGNPDEGVFDIKWEVVS